ncbi:MAG: 50S ribosomal protein L17 [Actinobacteria bacterium]|nr:50S ribosomal protein L17 [Actinomycetota bacterium]
MRHQKKGRKLKRDHAHRKALLNNLAKELVEHEKITTTVAKAKELRSVIEPLITLAKEDTLSNRRLAFAKLRSKALVHKLFTEIAPRHKERNGGYTRIVRIQNRNGDNAETALIEIL